jgi:hypothetical protein
VDKKESGMRLGLRTTVTAMFVRLNMAYDHRRVCSCYRRHGTEPVVKYGRKTVLYGDGAQPYLRLPTWREV